MLLLIVALFSFWAVYWRSDSKPKSVPILNLPGPVVTSTNQLQVVTGQSTIYIRPALATLNPIKLDVIEGGSSAYRTMASDLLQRSPKTMAKLSASRGRSDNGEISEDDISSIVALLTEVKGFTPTPHSGSAIPFERFTIAVIGGTIADDYLNAYFVRIPGAGWELLELRSVPPPLGTYAR